MSFFSSNEPADSKNNSEEAEVFPMVQTMREDLKNLKNNKGEGAKAFVPKLPTPLAPARHTANPFVKEPVKVASQEKTVAEKKINAPLIQRMVPRSTETEVSFQPEKIIVEKKIDTPTPAEPAFRPKIAIPQKFLERRNTKSDLNPSVVILPVSAEGRPQGKKSNLFLITGIVAIVLSLILGGIYFYLFVIDKKAKSLVSPVAVPPKHNVEIATKKGTVPPKEEPFFSLDKPNYLLINTETASLEELQKTLSSVADRVKEFKISPPVEFLVTDQNNNPILFSRFAQLLNMDVPPSLLSHIDEKFSLYVFNDAGSVRIGVNLTIDNPEAVLPVLSKIENTLPSIFQTLILEPGIVVPKTIDFKSNVYTPASQPSVTEESKKRQFALRYANIDIAKKVSIDYAVVGNHWYVGTSRNTLIALLNRIVQ